MCGNVQFMREKNIYHVFIAECFNTFENDFWFILPAFALGLNEGVHLNDCEVALKTIKKHAGHWQKRLGAHCPC